jgi:DNA-binding GntR family transcriptional regulator
MVKKMLFPAVTDQTLRHKVLELIRGAILTGQLSAGECLRENEIAAQMGISRVPVREALRELEHEGLLVSHPHRGTEVAVVSEEEVDHLYQLRAELEAFAIRSLMQQGNKDSVPKLRRLVNAMEKNAGAGQLTELAESDLEFHWTIVSGSGHHILAGVWRSMDGPIRARLYRALHGGCGEDLIRYTAESHRPLLEAISSGDTDKAVAAIKKHILETRTVIEKGLNIC